METPEFSAPGFHYNSQFTLEKTKNNGGSGGDSFIVDELLADFPSDDGMLVAADGGGGGDGASFEIETTGITGGGGMTSTTEESVTGGGGGGGGVHNSCNSSFSGSTEPSSSHFPGGGDIGCGGNFTDGQFSSELCVPYDDLAELEWLSNFVEESFSSDDLQKLQLISGMKAQTTDISQTYHFQPEPNRATSNTTTTMFRPEMSVPAKARSKRSRAPPCNWTSRLLAVSPSPPPPTTTVTDTTTVIPTPTMSSSSESDIIGKKKVTQKKKETFDNGLLPNSEGRRCLHCATDKTPQWRTGPMGPKTLCNACGVRYKSGRLVPEYRPAASPTFVLTKHSNSHRKVLELRRQKEFQRAQQHQQHHHQQQFIHPNMMFDVTPGDDFLIHQHLGTDFRQLI